MHMPHTVQLQAFSANFISPSPKLDKISLLFGGKHLGRYSRRNKLWPVMEPFLKCEMVPYHPRQTLEGNVVGQSSDGKGEVRRRAFDGSIHFNGRLTIDISVIIIIIII